MHTCSIAVGFSTDDTGVPKITLECHKCHHDFSIIGNRKKNVTLILIKMFY